MKNLLKTKKDISKQEIYDFIVAYIDDQIKTSLREMRNSDAFNKPAWSEFQAYEIGMQKAFFKLRELIPTSDQEGEVIE